VDQTCGTALPRIREETKSHSEESKRKIKSRFFVGSRGSASKDEKKVVQTRADGERSPKRELSSTKKKKFNTKNMRRRHFKSGLVGRFQNGYPKKRKKQGTPPVFHTPNLKGNAEGTLTKAKCRQARIAGQKMPLDATGKKISR